MIEPAIRTEALEREFKGGIKAVTGIDLEVSPGEIYGFLGPNGAGKTTTVRMLVTLLRPTGGRASVAGFDVASQPNKVRKHIGVALQEAALDMLMTARELMTLQAKLYGLSASEIPERVEYLIHRVGLEDAQDRRIGTFSGGMKRRLDLGLALVHRPTVLFLDEPTTGLDPVSRKRLWEEVKSLRSEGTTVFLTTQYLEEADQLADRVGIINAGSIVAEGTPEQLKAQVGVPHLEMRFKDDVHDDRITELLREIGELGDPSEEYDYKVSLPSGADGISSVVRRLEGSGLTVESLRLNEPTLDDVFLEKTGSHLEGTGSKNG